MLVYVQDSNGIRQETGPLLTGYINCFSMQVVISNLFS